MVSKLKSVFNSFLGPERPHVSTTGRKRSLDEDVSDEEEDDGYVTPNLKRPKLHSSPAVSSAISDSVNSEQSPFVRVAEWVKQKALSFGEHYFYNRRGEQGIEDKRSDAPRSQPSFEDMYICKPRVNGKRRQQAPTKLFKGSDCMNKISVVNIEESDSEPESTREENCNQQDVLSRLSGGGGGGDAGKHPCTTYHAVQPQSDLADLPTASISSHHQFEDSNAKHIFSRPSTKRVQNSPHQLQDELKPTILRNIPKKSNLATAAPRSTATSYAKVFPRSSLSQAHLQRQKASYTVQESIRLQHREEYQQLLQQFTTTDVNYMKPTPPVDTEITENITLEKDVEQQHTKRIPSTTVLGSTITISKVTSRKEIPGGRVLPHHYTSKRQIREAARQRLHVPSSELSMCVTPPSEKNSMRTPTQPDFDRPESPIITDVIAPVRHRLSTQTSLELSNFQKNLSKSVVAKEDWIKDLKAKFESSTRERIRRAEEEKIKTKIYEERRLKEMGKIEQTIRDRMLIAESEPPILPEVAEPEISEEEASEVGELAFLTEEMEEMIDKALVPQPAGQTMVEGFRCTLTRSNIQTLNGLNWLNDEVINFYMSLLVERSEKENYPKVHNFNTFFYPKLLQGGHKPLRRWTKKVDIFSKHLVLVPVHLGMHWCLSVIDMRKKTISYYDSMGNANPKCLHALKQYLYDEHLDKKQTELDMSDWKLVTCSEVPQQMNGSDCGMFACIYAEYICRDASLTFTQDDMPYFRRRMVWEIINKQLL